MTLLITLTHARLRASQGDLRSAREILRQLLEEQPDNVEARALLESWRTPGKPEPVPSGANSTEPGGPRPASRDRAPTRSATIARLERWLASIQR